MSIDLTVGTEKVDSGSCSQHKNRNRNGKHLCTEYRCGFGSATGKEEHCMGFQAVV